MAFAIARGEGHADRRLVPDAVVEARGGLPPHHAERVRGRQHGADDGAARQGATRAGLQPSAPQHGHAQLRADAQGARPGQESRGRVARPREIRDPRRAPERARGVADLGERAGLSHRAIDARGSGVLGGRRALGAPLHFDAPPIRGPRLQARGSGALVLGLREIREAAVGAHPALEPQAERGPARGRRQIALEPLRHGAARERAVLPRRAGREPQILAAQRAATTRVGLDHDLRARALPGALHRRLPREPHAGRGARHARERRADHDRQRVAAVAGAHEIAEAVVGAEPATDERHLTGPLALPFARDLETHRAARPVSGIVGGDPRAGEIAHGSPREIERILDAPLPLQRRSPARPLGRLQRDARGPRLEQVAISLHAVMPRVAAHAESADHAPWDPRPAAQLRVHLAGAHAAERAVARRPALVPIGPHAGLEPSQLDAQIRARALATAGRESPSGIVAVRALPTRPRHPARDAFPGR